MGIRLPARGRWSDLVPRRLPRRAVVFLARYCQCNLVHLSSRKLLVLRRLRTKSKSAHTAIRMSQMRFRLWLPLRVWANIASTDRNPSPVKGPGQLWPATVFNF